MFLLGDGPTTQIGYVNMNNHKCHGTLGVPGTGHLQYAYRLKCLNCGYVECKFSCQLSKNPFYPLI